MKTISRLSALIWLVLSCVTNAQVQNYTVKPGDSLSKIARTQGCSVDALAKANHISLSAVLLPGKTIKIPDKKGVSGAAGSTTGPNAESHVIKSGDTFSGISKQYGIPIDKLIAANPTLNPKSLKLGQKVVLKSTDQLLSKTPATDAGVSPTAASSTAPGTTAQERSTPAAESKSAANTGTPQIHAIAIEEETTYGEFASKHGTSVERLNDLNGLDLTSATVLAKGSELYVPVSH